jgi:hypothetical protein
MRVIAFITDVSAIRDILVHRDEPTAPPRIAPARGPPLWEATGAEWVDPRLPAVPSAPLEPANEFEPAYEFDQRVTKHPPAPQVRCGKVPTHAACHLPLWSRPTCRRAPLGNPPTNARINLLPTKIDG